MSEPTSISIEAWMRLISLGATSIFMAAVLFFLHDVWKTFKDWGPKIGSTLLERWDRAQSQRESDSARHAASIDALKMAFIKEQRDDRHDIGDAVDAMKAEIMLTVNALDNFVREKLK